MNLLYILAVLDTVNITALDLLFLQLYRLRKVRNAPYLDMERKIFPLIVAITGEFCSHYVNF